MTKRLCFTVDVDRDANECVPGHAAAVSPGGEARFASSEAGVNIILDLLNDIGMKATFFAEARTLENIDVTFGSNEVAMHGLDHEDMTGEISGIRLSDSELNDIMQTSSDIITDRTGTRPKGFRAPYMRTDERIMRTLPSFGVIYDSSLYADIKSKMHPYDAGNGVKEIPVPAAADGNGKRMTAYLWPMHEGTRTFDEYIKMADRVKEGVLVIATHSWHMVESRSGGMMSKAEIKKNISGVRKIITSVLDSGFDAVRMIDAVE